MIRYLLLVLLVLLPMSLRAQEEPEPKPEASRFAAAAWCVVHQTGTDEIAAADAAVGCDVGVGVAIHRYRRLAWVAVLGSKSTGAGIAWVVPGTQPVVAIAVGVVAPYDSNGISGGGVQIALGATMSFRGGQQ